MTFTKLPSVWRISDFIAFGLSGVITIGFLIYGLFVHAQGSAQWPYLMAAVAASFLFIYWRVIVVRQNDIKGFVLVGGPKYGVLVNLGTYQPPGGVDKLAEIIETTAIGWTAAFSREEIDNALTKGYIWCWFKPGTIDMSQVGTPYKVAGYEVGDKLVVGYSAVNANLDSTAFAHELGHYIQGTVTGDWDLNTHHARSKRLGLP